MDNVDWSKIRFFKPEEFCCKSVITAVIFIVLAFFGSSTVIGVVEKLKSVIKN